jgi:release factor glutamine methyltransferase
MIKTLNKSRTIASVLGDASLRLARAGVGTARLDARLLLGHALDCTAETIVGQPERILADTEVERFGVLLARRLGREPAAQILGEREFWSLSFRVTRDTLIPRPESETIIEAALSLVPDRMSPLRVLDLGVGSGCLLLALLSELSAAEGIGVDRSEAACRVARDNAARLGLASRARFLVGDWASALAGDFDLVVANPPYVSKAELEALEPEVARFEPRAALDGGCDGLASYRALALGLARVLVARGHVFVEFGAGQGDAVSRIMTAAGLREHGRCLDLAGRERCLIMAIP